MKSRNGISNNTSHIFNFEYHFTLTHICFTCVQVDSTPKKFLPFRFIETDSIINQR